MMKRTIWLIPLIMLLALGWLEISKQKEPPVVKTVIETTPTIDSSSPVASTSHPIATSTPPASFLIANVPFQSQAPLGNWDPLHDEACEEAVIILDHYFLDHKTIDPQTMDQQILKMVAFEIGHFGEHRDITVKETLDLAQNFYSLGGKVYTQISIDDIKNQIAKGYPVILPTAGRELGNPNFRQPGPVYHMILAIGYDSRNFIVQDVGTRNGDHYKYNQQTLFSAIHDWNGMADKIDQGGKSMLVLSQG